MDPLLKGNYEIEKTAEEKAGDAGGHEATPPISPLTEQFEREALRRLAGSIAFVRKDLFVWRDDRKVARDAPGAE